MNDRMGKAFGDMERRGLLYLRTAIAGTGAEVCAARHLQDVGRDGRECRTGAGALRSRAGAMQSMRPSRRERAGYCREKCPV